jgi:HEAT repeat protein
MPLGSPLVRAAARAAVLVAVLGLGSGAIVSGETSRLASTDAAEAYKAIEEAAKAKDLSSAGALLDAGFQTAHAHIAVACGEALAALGPEAAHQPGFARVFEKMQRSKDEHGQQNAARVLGAWGDPFVDEHLSYLASGRRPPDVAAEALVMIGHLPVSKEKPFPKCVAAVLSAFRSQYASVRMAACSAARRIKDPSFGEPLVDLARKSQDEYSGLYAIWALIGLKKRGDLGTFVRVVESDAKRETVQACLKGITDLSGPDDVETLLGHTRATKRELRDAACVALGRLAREGAFATPKEGTSAAAPLRAKVVDRLLQIVEDDPDWEVRDGAGRALQRFGEPAHAAIAAKVPALVGHNDRDVALAAIELAGHAKAEGAFKRLLDIAVYDKDAVRRLSAARALGYVHPGNAVQELLGGAAKDKKGKDTTLHMIRALGYVRSEAAFEGLVGLVTDASASDGFLREVERSLERLTGRRFGRKAEPWKLWYEKAKTKDPFHPHIGRFDRGKNRREAIEKRLYGLTETTERAVENGLRWLESTQHAAGWWDGNEKGYGGVVNCEPAYTGLSLLALLGAGYNPETGKYHETIRRAAEFLAATQFYDGGFPVSGGGDDSWIYAYLIGMAVWGITEAYGGSTDDTLRDPAQRGIDYLCRVQTPGAGWRYGPRYVQTDTSATSWVLMTLKAGALLGLEVPQKAYDGIDWWLERCQSDITGMLEKPEDMVADYDKEVGAKYYFKAITGYFELKSEKDIQQTSMTACGMTCRFFMGWQRSHPFLIGSANYLMDFLPQWRKGLEKGQAIAWYFYFWYYGTISMHQMGGRYWRAWNEKIKTMLPANQRKEPPALAGSWDPDTALLNGGRIFSTAMACMTLETYYRFSPLMLETEADTARKKEADGGAAMDGK